MQIETKNKAGRSAMWGRRILILLALALVARPR